VLADLVEGLTARDDVRVAALRTRHRFGESIGALAEAIRIADADRAVELLRTGSEHIEWIDSDRPTDRLRDVLVPHALRVREAAVLGDSELALATLDEHRLLCAHRRGPYGASHWNRQVQRWLSEETGQPLSLEWYAGRPLLVTANDYGLRVYNGDTGVVVAGPDGLRAVIARASGPRGFAPSRLADIETMHAMTIHKSQGSQADEVTVLMPPEDSRLLTRELFYTAVTRAKVKVRVVGSEAEVRAALARRALRASGLRLRLQATATTA
jgi:exodeoxyribonuclease V alpha subunit